MNQPGLWVTVAVVVAAAGGIVLLLRRFDRRVDLLESYRLDLDDDEILDRLEAELDRRAIRAIDDAYGRWTR